MRMSMVIAATIGSLTAGTLGLAGPATAMPADNRSAADTIAGLEAKGHHVQINGPANVPLSFCRVTGTHGLNNSNLDSSGNRIDDDLHTTVYVDVRCHDG